LTMCHFPIGDSWYGLNVPVNLGAH